MNASGKMTATVNDTSLSFTSSDLTTERALSEAFMEDGDYRSFSDRLALATQGFSNGEYAVDYVNGIIYGLKASTGTTLTAGAYKVNLKISGGSTTVPSSVSVTAVVPGTGATNLGKAEDASHTSGDVGVMMLAVRNDTGAALAGTTGDYIPLTTDPNGNLRVATGSGGAAGGGNNTYSTEQGDFTATPTNATFSIVLSVDSIGGSAITAANFANGILKIVDVSLTPDEYKTVTLDKFTWTAATKTLDITNCTGAFTLGTGDVVSLTLTGPDKMRDSATDSQKTSLIRDVSDQYVGDTLAALSNIAANTTGYLYFTMDAYKFFALQCETSDATPTDTLTLTVEATYQDDGTANSSCTYQDVTSAWFGVTSVVDTDTTFEKDTPCTAKHVRLKYVTSNTGGSDADLTVYLRRSY
jgi:hypothetical protein